jgi:hypothetical protein
VPTSLYEFTLFDETEERGEFINKNMTTRHGAGGHK